LCARRGWDVARALDLLESLLRVIKVVESGFYADCEEHAKRRIAARDLDDWPLVALALALGANVWTEDTDFFGSGLPTWTTETVEIYFNGDPLWVNESPALPYEAASR
jgi:predicted nucleic acid-binding protein